MLADIINITNIKPTCMCKADIRCLKYLTHGETIVHRWAYCILQQLGRTVKQTFGNILCLFTKWVLAFLEKKWEAVNQYVPLATVKGPYDTIHCSTTWYSNCCCPITHKTVERTQTYPL